MRRSLQHLDYELNRPGQFESGGDPMKKAYQAPVLTKRAPLAQVAATVKAITLFQNRVE
jgi:hypothetical protein